jgi:hypothetical protein
MVNIMEYVYLIFQIILMLGIFIFKTNDRYLVNYNEFYKKYLIVELITQVICVVANVIRCIGKNAPYPPSKTKRIIRKHIV